MTQEEIMQLIEEAYLRGLEDAGKILIEIVEKKKKHEPYPRKGQIGNE